MSVVDMHFMRSDIARFHVPDCVKMVKENWLQRFAWWLVERANASAPYFQDREVCKQVRFDPKDAFNSIYEAHHNLFDPFYRSPPKQVLIGQEDMAELMNCPEIRDAGGSLFEFQAEAGFNGRIIGLPIKVIPHMKGVLVL